MRQQRKRNQIFSGSFPIYFVFRSHTTPGPIVSILAHGSPTSGPSVAWIRRCLLTGANSRRRQLLRETSRSLLDFCRVMKSTDLGGIRGGESVAGAAARRSASRWPLGEDTHTGVAGPRGRVDAEDGSLPRPAVEAAASASTPLETETTRLSLSPLPSRGLRESFERSH